LNSALQTQLSANQILQSITLI